MRERGGNTHSQAVGVSLRRAITGNFPLPLFVSQVFCSEQILTE